MYQPDENTIRNAINELKDSRDSYFQSLIRSGIASIRQALENVKLTPRDGETAIEMACRVVDARYPELGIEVAPEYVRPQSIRTPLDTVEAVPVHPSSYADIAGYQASADGYVSEAAPVGGFVASDFDADERIFIAYLDRYGSYVKLPVIKFLRLSGFDEDARAQSSVLAVDMPSWWFESTFIEKFIASLMDGFHTGDIEKVRDVIDNFCVEQNWDPNLLWQHYFPADEPTTGSGDAPTEQFELTVSLEEATQAAPVLNAYQEATQLNPVVVADEHAPRDQGDWRQGV